MSYVVYRISKRKRYVNGELHGVCRVAQYTSRTTQYGNFLPLALCTTYYILYAIYGIMEVIKDAALVCEK